MKLRKTDLVGQSTVITEHESLLSIKKNPEMNSWYGVIYDKTLCYSVAKIK